MHNGKQIVASGELKPTDRVIVSGVQFVRPGVKVTPGEATATEAVEEAEGAAAA